MKQQIIIFFAIVATLQFCSTTASPVEPNKAKDEHEQGHNQPQPNTVPKVNMQKVQAVKELCEVLINSSNAHEAAKQQKPNAHQGAEHGKTENHEGTVGHAENGHAEHKNEQGKSEHKSSEPNQEHVNQADQGQHHHHHHHHHNNGEGNTETQNHQ